MKSIAVKSVLVCFALASAMFVAVGTANASHVQLQLVSPSQLSVGHSAEVQAVVRSTETGEPIAGAAIVFYMQASFDGVSGKVELGKAVTGADGVAALTYLPRSAGEHEIRVEYLAPGGTEPELATRTHTVTGTAQLYRSTAGIQVPGLNVWLIIAVVSAVWLILLSAVLRVIAIARTDDAAGDFVPGHPQPRPPSSNSAG